MTLFNLINMYVPKSTTILFSSFPDFSDNALALYDYIVTNRPDISNEYRLIWICEDEKNAPSSIVGNPNSCIIKKKSLRGLFACLRAKYVFHTHGFFGSMVSRCARDQLIVNLWHGCGFKDISPEERCYYGDMNFVTSELYRDIHSEIFNIPRERVLPFGLPRNDILFSNTDIRLQLGLDSDKRVYLWMPTYRKAAFGHDGVDGRFDSFGLSTLSMDDLCIINKTLSKNNSLLVIKPHPMDSIQLVADSGFSSIRIVSNDDLFNKGFSLYELLATSDVLMSDYSSVIVDYMLLDRPIVLCTSDFDEYASTRGFVFNNIEEYMPGPLISSVKEMIEYFDSPYPVENTWKDRRAELTKLFHNNVDNCASERICDHLFSRYSGGEK